METIPPFSLPPGFGFHPTDVELISHYLKRKNLGLKIDFEVIPEVDIYKHEPWDLPAKCHIPTQNSKWHFFNSPDRKYPNGSRSNRATAAGYWKSTGKDRNIRLHNQVIGTKKTLVFHKGRPPSGKRTDWIMHEYYMDANWCNSASGTKDVYVLCRVTKRNELAFDSEHASLKNEETDTCPKLPKDVSVPVVQEGSLSPTESREDLEAWLTELYDPDFCAIHTINELKSEPKEDITSLALKTESVDFIPEFSEGFNLLHSGDDIYSSLPFDFPDPNSGVFKNSYLRSTDVDPSTQFNAVNPAFSQLNNNTDAGIQRRVRHVTTSDHQTVRLKLQVNKMELKNRQAVNQTIKIASHDRHLDLNDGLQYSTGEVKEKHNSGGSTGRFSRQPGLNRLFLGACIAGTAAVVLYFILDDARQFLGSFF